MTKKDEQLLDRVITKLIKFLGPDKAAKWLTAQNPHLGNLRPTYLIYLGRGHKVEQFVDNALSENERDV